MCDGLGRQFSYTCPNTTLFQQRMLICDHWYMVNCSRSETDYKANLLIGQNKPFVEDSEKHPYNRTPRPDLLSQPTASEYSIVYRKTEPDGKIDIVGLDSEIVHNNETLNDTEKTWYNIPTHWSTEYSKQNAVVTEASSGRDGLKTKENLQEASQEDKIEPRPNVRRFTTAPSVGVTKESLDSKASDTRDKSQDKFPLG